MPGSHSGYTVNITDLIDPLYNTTIVSIGTKSTFVETVYNQKISDSSHVCRGLYSTRGMGHEWVLAMVVVQDTSTWLECQLYLQMEIRDSKP